jgi:hypothetical protein
MVYGICGIFGIGGIPKSVTYRADWGLNESNPPLSASSIIPSDYNGELPQHLQRLRAQANLSATYHPTNRSRFLFE